MALDTCVKCTESEELPGWADLVGEGDNARALQIERVWFAS